MKPLEFIAFSLGLVLLVGLIGVNGLGIGSGVESKHTQDSEYSVTSASAADVVIQAPANRSQIESVNSHVLTIFTAPPPKSEGSTPHGPIDLQLPVLPLPAVPQQLPALSNPQPLDFAPVVPLPQPVDLIDQIQNLLLSVLPSQQPVPVPAPAPEDSSYRYQSQSVLATALPQLVAYSSSPVLIPNRQILPLLALPNPQPSMPDKIPDLLQLQLLSASQSPTAESENVIIPPIESPYFALQQVEQLEQAPKAFPPVSPVPALLLVKPVEINISGQSGRQHLSVEKPVPPQFNLAFGHKTPTLHQATLDPVPAGVTVARKTCWTTVLGRFLRRKPNC